MHDESPADPVDIPLDPPSEADEQASAATQGVPLPVTFEQLVSLAKTESAESPKRPDVVVAEERALKTREELQSQKAMQAFGHKEDVHKTRLLYADYLFKLICWWLVVTVLILVGAATPWLWFEMSDKVLIALITSATANVLGLFYVVAKWLYPPPTPKR